MKLHTINSYLFSSFSKYCLPDKVKINQVTQGGYFERSKMIKTGKSLIPHERVIFWIIEIIYEKGKISIRDLSHLMETKGYKFNTIKAQIYRLTNDPFVYVKNSYVYPRLLKNGDWILNLARGFKKEKLLKFTEALSLHGNRWK